MSREEKALAQVLGGTKDGVTEILNLQPNRAKAKAYQVKQVRDIVVKYSVGSQKDESDT